MPKRDYIQKLARERYEGQIRNAFLECLDDISDGITLKRIESLIRAGALDAAVEAAGVTPAKFESMRTATAAAVGAGGKETVKALPAIKSGGQRIKVAFNQGSRRAVNAVDELHYSKIREVTDDTRRAIRDHIQYGLEQGKNPRTVARGIRGQWDNVAKKYRGGVIGLTEQQERWVLNAERQLRSGDPKELSQYLGRKLRDRRYDRTVLRAINDGTPIPEGKINDMAGAYRRKATAYRAETIARDQSLEALSKGQDVAIDQHVAEGAIKDRDVLQFWINSGDARVRDTHQAVPAMNRGGVRRGDMFETPLGPLKRPRDQTSPGSVPANTISCRCSLDIQVKRQ